MEELLDTALRVMAEDGVGALNLSLVAARMGLHQSSLYAEIVPAFVELEVAVPHLSPAVW